MEFDKNKRKILQAIHFLETPTRNAISNYAELSRVLVSTTLNELENEGTIAKKGKTKNLSGRPSHIYEIASQVVHVLGIDIGSEHTWCFEMDALGNINHSEKTPTNPNLLSPANKTDFLKAIRPMIEEFLSKEYIHADRSCVGISLPGMVNPDAGIWLHNFINSRFTSIHVTQILEELFPLHIFIEDRARSATYFEWKKRTIRKDPFIYLYLGSGVGAGIMTGGSMFRGNTGLSGEIGHTTVNQNGIRCSCGNIGCLETVVSTPNILRQFQERLNEGVFSSLQDIHSQDENGITAEDILKAAESGDKLSESTLLEIGGYLGDAVVLLIKLFNPGTLIIGGPGSLYGSFFKTPIDIKLKQMVRPEMLNNLDIDFAEYKASQEAIGVGFLTLDSYWTQY